MTTTEAGPSPSHSSAGYRWAYGLCATRASFLLLLVGLVAIGWVSPIGYGPLAFQGVASVAVAVAIAVGRRVGAAVSLGFVGYDLVLGLLVGDTGWRWGVRMVSGVLLLAALATIAIGRSAPPGPGPRARVILAGVVVGAALTLGAP